MKEICTSKTLSSVLQELGVPKVLADAFEVGLPVAFPKCSDISSTTKFDPGKDGICI